MLGKLAMSTRHFRSLHPDRPPLACALVAAAAVLPYLGTLGYGFLWDDHVQIAANPWLRNGEWVRFWNAPLWGYRPDAAAAYYRPVFGSFLALVARAGGFRPEAFHVASVLLHASVAVTVGALGRRLFRSPRAGLAAGLLFALLPVHAEAVSWAGAQGDLLAALFGALALLLVAREPLSPLACAGGAAAFLLAALSKETALPLLLPLLVLLARRGLRRAAAHIAPFVAALVVWLALRLHALGTLAPPPRSTGATSDLATAPALLLSYLADLGTVAPRILASVEPSGWGDPLVATGLLAAVTLFALLLRARREAGVLAALLLFAGTLAPALLPRLVGEVNLAERYLYLPSLGLALVAGAAAARVGSARPAARAVLVVACAAATVLTAARARPYRDDVTFFREAVRGNPGLFEARNDLGLALIRAGDPAGASRELEAAIAIRPGGAEAWTNLGRAREALGRPADALAAFERARVLAPGDPAPAVAVARIHRRAGNSSEAIRVLDAVGSQGSYEVLAERAALALDAGDTGTAESLLRRAIRLFPELPRAYALLAQAAFLRGDAAEAERLAHEALARGGGTLARRVLAEARRASRIPGSPRPEGASR